MGDGLGWELFAGVAAITKAFLKAGFEMLPPFDVKIDPGHDVMRDDVLAWMLGVIASGVLTWIWIAIPCTSFSALQNGHRDGPWRSAIAPCGFGREEVEYGNRRLERVSEIIRQC